MGARWAPKEGTVAKPALRPPFDQLAGDLIATILGGFHEWRPDLNYPQSHSDMQGGVMAVLRKYDVKLRPVPLDRSEIEVDRG